MGTPGAQTTRITGSINSVVEPSDRVIGSAGLSTDSSTPRERHITPREPLIGEHRQLSPEEQQERFKRMTDARTKQFQSRDPARRPPIRPRDLGSRSRAVEVARSTEPSEPTPVDNTSYAMSGWGFSAGFNRPTDPQWFNGPTEP